MALLLIPLVSLTAIWAYAAALTFRAVLDRPDIGRIVTHLALPVTDSVRNFQMERRAALVYTASPHDTQAAISYDKQERATDQSLAKLRTQLATGVRGAIDSRARSRLDTFLSTAQGLTALRGRVAARHISLNDAYAGYNALVGPAYDLFDELIPIGNSVHDGQRRAVAGLERAREDVSRQDALMAAAITTGRISRTELTSFTFAVGQERNYYTDELPVLDGAMRAPYDAYWKSGSGRALRRVQDAVIAAGPSTAPVVAAHMSWPSVEGTAFDDLNRMNNTSTAQFSKEARPIPRTLLIEAAVTGIVGLVAVIASLIVSVRIGRSLIRDLTGLRREAQEVSGTRLPRVMRRLAAGEEVDVETEVPRLSYADDEIGQVGKALNTLQRAAVEAAVRQADMRKGVSDVFVNLARRSQVLLHRQLTLLDAMERRTENAEELGDLFRLDHMTTRMRRHAEGLVILSGAAPSRQWRKPVQLMDVVRAAIAEVEDYERIDVRRLPRLAVAGAAVADLTHLLAELIENAAVFSPPHTQVKLHGEPVANGFVLEIDDRGLGLTPDALLEANLRLAETPEFELSDTDRLGLFVVSRLARRHGVRVSLRQSSYGGTTAVVLIPAGLLTDTGEDTGATRISEADRPGATDPTGDTEQDFRTWGLGVAAESQREHTRQDDLAQQDDLTRPDEPPTVDVDEPEFDAPVPLPRRRRSRSAPVLVSDHGRDVDPDRDITPGRDIDPDHGRDSGRDFGRRPAPGPVPRHETAPGSEAPAGGSAGAQSAPAGGALPRRVRQANLAPQLRAAPAPETAQDTDDSGPDWSADELRDRMAAFQRGWQRGREVAEAETEAGPGDVPPGTAAPAGPATETPSAPRTTSEGNSR
ncbi:nitrate- and nitrite sensing domain-containing protein [Actinacidiphila acididurans]|uniref:nitrate- and nitrite sensing domain-containing protein n=1 Tax=Actinacidiphila acididurans TaxID=2784346 RepID=UPI0027DDDF20|nr:nitrate- and nitrite sensing domain-containing protein [Actinacidiphila acididurans]